MLSFIIFATVQSTEIVLSIHVIKFEVLQELFNILDSPWNVPEIYACEYFIIVLFLAALVP